MNMSLGAVTVKTPVILLAIAGFVVASAIGLAGIAHAAVGPTVGLNVRNAANAVVTFAPIGSTLYASTTVASSTSVVAPTGTMSFNLFSGLTCTGTSSTTVVPLAAGFAMSPTTTLAAAGIAYSAHYSGDANNLSSDSECVVVMPTGATTSILTMLSASSVVVGTPVSDSSSLLGTTNTAGGTVSYKVFSNNTCSSTPLFVSSVSVTNHVVPPSAAFTLGAPGTYYWQALYSGDSQNGAATSTCGLGVLSVVATSTPPVVVPPLSTTTSGTISGIIFNDLNRNHTLNAGEPGLPGFVIQLHLGKKNKAPVIATTTSDANGAYSFSGLSAGTYYLEEMHMTGWKQTTKDNKVKLHNKKLSAVRNFANIAKTATTTMKKHEGSESDHETNHASSTVGHIENHDTDHHTTGHQGDEKKKHKNGHDN